MVAVLRCRDDLVMDQEGSSELFVTMACPNQAPMRLRASILNQAVQRPPLCPRWSGVPLCIKLCSALCERAGMPEVFLGMCASDCVCLQVGVLVNDAPCAGLHWLQHHLLSAPKHV